MSDTFDHALDAFESYINDPDNCNGMDSGWDDRYANRGRSTQINQEDIDIKVAYVFETAKAILVCDEEQNEIWLPKSQIDGWDNNMHIEKGEMVEITIPEWLAIKNNLI